MEIAKYKFCIVCNEPVVTPLEFHDSIICDRCKRAILVMRDKLEIDIKEDE